MRTPISRIENIAGVFVIIAILALLTLIFVPGIMAGRFLKSFPLAIAARDGQGLGAGDKLTIQGIQVGEVTRLELDESNRVLLRCKVYSEYSTKITEGTTASIILPPVMGSAHIRLSPGTGPRLAPGTLLVAKEETPMIERFGVLALSFEETMGRVNRILDTVNEEMMPIVQKTLEHVEEGLQVFPQLTLTSKGAMEDGRKVMESLKRSFFIRANLPKDREEGGMIPASSFEPMPPIE